MSSDKALLAQLRWHEGWQYWERVADEVKGEDRKVRLPNTQAKIVLGLWEGRGCLCDVVATA